MPLNKFAGWGVALLDKPRPPGLTSVTRLGLGAINSTLLKMAPAQTPVVKTPSSTALRIVWSLNAVRDALSDQGDPNVGDTNQQIDARLHTDAVDEVLELLKSTHPELLEHYRGQFRLLEADPDDADAFDLERRERLAELTTLELLVMTTVGDTPTPQLPAVKVRAVRRSANVKRR
jgi:hypothetical protein